MDLIQYLSQGKDIKGKLIKRKGKKKLDKIPRRGRGFGQRHRAYREKKEKDSSIDKQLLALLTTIVKQNQPKIDLSNPEALNPFIEKDRQTYSMKFDSNKKPDKEDLYTMDEKKGIRKQITMGEGEDMVDRQNKLADYETKWEELVETQESLKQQLDDIPDGNIRGEAQENFRLQNLEIKENVFSLQQELQEDLNQAENVKAYKDFVDFQKKFLENSVNNFVSVDNRLAQELKTEKTQLGEDTEGFKILQEQTFQEKEELIKGNKLLQIDLEKSQSKEMELKELLDKTTSDLTKQKEKVYQMETNPAKSPPRVEVEEVELPKPKPTEEELKAKKEKKEALRIGREQIQRKKEQEEKRNVILTQELAEWSKGSSSYSKTIKKKVIELFGSEVNEKIKALGGSLEPKQKKLKQLLQEKRGVEF